MIRIVAAWSPCLLRASSILRSYLQIRAFGGRAAADSQRQAFGLEMPASGLRGSGRFSRAAPHVFAVRFRHFTEDLREQFDRVRLQAPLCETCLNGGGENPPRSAAVNQGDGGFVVPRGSQLRLDLLRVQQPDALDGFGKRVKRAPQRDQLGAPHLFDRVPTVPNTDSPSARSSSD